MSICRRIAPGKQTASPVDSVLSHKQNPREKPLRFTQPPIMFNLDQNFELNARSVARTSRSKHFQTSR